MLYATLLPILPLTYSFKTLLTNLPSSSLPHTFFAVAPAFILPVISIFRNWTYAMFYLMAELWGSVVLSLLFWGFANDINTVDEAKSYYPLFGLVANLALILSGQYVRWTSVIRAGNIPFTYSLPSVPVSACMYVFPIYMTITWDIIDHLITYHLITYLIITVSSFNLASQIYKIYRLVT